MYVNISDSSRLMPEVPASCIVSNTSGDGVSTLAGGFVTGVSLQRGYRCNKNVLKANLNVTRAISLATKMSNEGNWTVKVSFHSIDIQPFLVTNDIVKDPLLCK